MRPLGITPPVTASPALLPRLAGPPGLVRAVVATPEVEVAGGWPRSAAGHGPAAREAAPALDRAARHALRHLRPTFHGAGALRLLRHRVGWRPMPARGPLVGPATPDGSLYRTVRSTRPSASRPPSGGWSPRSLATGRPAAPLRNCRPAVFPVPDR